MTQNEFDNDLNIEETNEVQESEPVELTEETEADEELRVLPTDLSDAEKLNAIECILFVSGEPVAIRDLCRVFQATELELRALINDAASAYEKGSRGLLYHITDDSVQLISNRAYAPFVEELLQPKRSKSFSQAMMETLTIIAYRQPITRSEIDFIRGVRSEYSINQLIKQDLVEEVGRKEVIGHPQLLGTTDKFLRRFGLHSLAELPDYEKLSDPDILNEQEEA